MKDPHGVIITEVYKNSVPRFRAYQTVDRLLSGIPRKYLAGLKTVVLTDAAELNRGRRREKIFQRKRKIAVRESRGLYHHKWRGEPAWIEIFVDRVVGGWPPLLLRIRFFCDFVFSEVLYHEVGHHIHETQEPEYHEREDVANRWARRLGKYYFRRKYWYAVFPLKFFSWLLKPFKPLLDKKMESIMDRET